MLCLSCSPEALQPDRAAVLGEGRGSCGRNDSASRDNIWWHVSAESAYTRRMSDFVGRRTRLVDLRPAGSQWEASRLDSVTMEEGIVGIADVDRITATWDVRGTPTEWAHGGATMSEVWAWEAKWSRGTNKIECVVASALVPHPDGALSFYQVAAQVARHLGVAPHVCRGGREGAQMRALVLQLFRVPHFWRESSAKWCARHSTCESAEPSKIQFEKDRGFQRSS